MKRGFLWAVGIGLTLQAMGASVAWNTFTQKIYPHTDEGGNCSFVTGIERTEERDPSSPMQKFSVAEIWIHSVFSKKTKTVTLTGTESAVLTVCCVWLPVGYGDFISHETMAGRSDYFVTYFNTGVDADVSNPITMKPGNLYLAVMQDATWKGHNDYLPVDYYYGWIELNVSATGEVTLVRDAFALDGSPLYAGVGPTPEPTTGLLLLLGLGVFSLRRKPNPCARRSSSE